MVVRHAIMTQTRRFVITVWPVVQSTVTNMNVIEWADVCAIEHNVCVWDDLNLSVLYVFIDRRRDRRRDQMEMCKHIKDEASEHMKG